MGVNKPVGDNARNGAVKKRSQLKNPLTKTLAQQECWSVHGGEEEREEIQRRSAREMMGRFFLGIVIVSIALIIALYWHIVAL